MWQRHSAVTDGLYIHDQASAHYRLRCCASLGARQGLCVLDDVIKVKRKVTNPVCLGVI
eukprot:SAG31_NODE_4556_length_3142_cov_1.901413_3_plen_59_part_00